MSEKIQFGISVPVDVAEEIDTVVEMLNGEAIGLETDRSEVVVALIDGKLADLNDPAEDVYQEVKRFREEIQ